MVKIRHKNRNIYQIDTGRTFGYVSSFFHLQGFTRRSKLLTLGVAGLLTFGMATAVASDRHTDSNQPVSASSNNQGSLENGAALENLTHGVKGLGAQVNLKAATEALGRTGSQVTVNGSVSTTSDDGTTKTETFHKSFDSGDGNSSNSLNININTNASSDAKVKVREKNNSDIDIDLRESTEVRIR